MKLLAFVLLVAFAATHINAVSFYEVVNDEWEAWKAFHGKIQAWSDQYFVTYSGSILLADRRLVELAVSEKKNDEIFRK